MSGSAPLPTTVSEKVLSRLWVLGTGLLTTLAARSVVGLGWRVVTGAPPPRRDDAEVTRVRALIWSAASMAGLAVTRLLVRRTGLGTPER